MEKDIKDQLIDIDNYLYKIENLLKTANIIGLIATVALIILIFK